MNGIIYDGLRSVNTKPLVGPAGPVSEFRCRSFGVGVSGVGRGRAWQALCIRRERRATVILTLVFLCLVLWFFGLMTSYSLGGALHILLVVAIVLFLVHLIQGRSIGNA
jgi:hypothetical protein